MRFIYGLFSSLLCLLLMAFVIGAGLDIPDWAVGLSVIIGFAGGCAGGD